MSHPLGEIAHFINWYSENVIYPSCEFEQKYIESIHKVFIKWTHLSYTLAKIEKAFYVIT